MKKDKAIRNAKKFDELLNIQYGEIGSKSLKPLKRERNIL
jgi:hypothetical protein